MKFVTDGKSICTRGEWSHALRVLGADGIITKCANNMCDQGSATPGGLMMSVVRLGGKSMCRMVEM